jgi:Phage endonuclease I
VTFDEILKSTGINYAYEQQVLQYTVPETKRKYLPDFTIEDSTQPKVVFETKGRLTTEDRKKLSLVAGQHPDTKIVLVFGYPNNRLRKGSPTTYARWAELTGFPWLDIKQVKENPECIFNMIKKLKGGSLKESPKKKRKS